MGKISLQLEIYVLGRRIILKKSGSRTPRVELEEIGPSLDLVKRRVKLASDDLWESAMKKPKTLKVRKTIRSKHFLCVSVKPRYRIQTGFNFSIPYKFCLF